MGVSIPPFCAELEVREVQKVAKKRVFWTLSLAFHATFWVSMLKKTALKFCICLFWFHTPLGPRTLAMGAWKCEKQPLPQAREYWRVRTPPSAIPTAPSPFKTSCETSKLSHTNSWLIDVKQGLRGFRWSKNHDLRTASILKDSSRET